MATSKPARSYVDACYYIDVVRGRQGTLDLDRVLHIPFIEKLLLAAQNGDIEVWGSTLLIAECLAIEKDDLAVPKHVQDAFKSLLTSGNPVKLQAVDVFIAERARSLRWDHQIKCGGGADMLHIATALELGCQEFITTNRKRGPLNTACVSKLAALGLRIIEAPQTALIPAHLNTPLLDGSGA
jgi:hypothetical protein